jgi:hypothetical protein
MHRSCIHPATVALAAVLALGACGSETTPTGPATGPELYNPGGGAAESSAGLAAILPSNTWGSATPMTTAREGLVTATVNGIVYAIGGAVAGKAVQTVEAYDPATQTWSNHPNLPRRRDDPSGAAVIDGKIYAP